MYIENRVFSAVMAGLILLSLATNSCTDTIFLANFDGTYDAVFAKGDRTFRMADDMEEGSVKLVEGKYGGGLFVGRNVPALAISYATKENFKFEKGTLEFWFRPEWTMADTEDIMGPNLFKYITFFSTSGDPTRFCLYKNQYNWLIWDYRLDYQTKGKVITQYSSQSDVIKPGKWTHMAVSWDTGEARLFIDGNLVSISDIWDIPGMLGDRMALGSPGYGKGLGADGTFDDFRISDHQRYISSFIPPDTPLKVDVLSSVPTVPSPSQEEKDNWQKKRTMFFVDFRYGLVANFSLGNGLGGSNSILKIEEKDGRQAVRLNRRAQIGDTLWFPTYGNINVNMSTVDIDICFSDPLQLPAVIFDTSKVVCNPFSPQDQHARSGTRLILDPSSRMVFECIEGGKLLSYVMSCPLTVEAGRWHRFSVSWGGGVRLYFDGKKVAEENSFPLPSTTDKYFFVGSDSQGINTIDGWIGRIEITLWNTLSECPSAR
ncbi:MAG: LamG domain-containing protein [bacterium]|nr:LamG domain-containing protein [bacterium]